MAETVAVGALLYALDAATGGGSAPLPQLASMLPDRELAERGFAAAGGTRPRAPQALVPILSQVRVGARVPAAPAAAMLQPERLRAFRQELAARVQAAGEQTVSGLLRWLDTSWADLPWGAVRDVPLMIGARCAAAFTEVLGQGDAAALVAGDLSGVQAFLYTRSDEGALRDLRARSFFLDLLVEDIQAELLERLDLSPACGVYVGGGRLYVLAPAAAAPAAAQSVQALYAERLFATFGTELGAVLACATLEAGAADRAWRELGRLLGQAKLRRFAPAMADPGTWEPADPESECSICGAERADLKPLRSDEPDVLACAPCRDFHAAGEMLAGLRAVARGGQGEAGAATLRLGSRTWSLYTEVPPGVPAGADLLWLVGEGLGQGMRDPRIRHMDVPECTARGENGAPATLGELAAGSTGASLLGTLRADVDHLGLVLREGLAPDCRDVAHYAALFGALSTFFRRQLPRVLQARRPGMLGPAGGARTLVYAGGDDLLLVGAWDAVAEASFLIHDEFAAYVRNPALTLSAGFVVADEHTPLRTLALLAGEAEDVAKEAGRDRISPLYAPPPAESPAANKPDGALTFTWDALREGIRSVAQPLSTVLEVLERGGGNERGLSRAVLHRLADLGRVYRDQQRYAFPQIYWLLARTREDLERRAGRDSPAVRNWVALCSLLSRTSTLQALPVLCTWLDLLARG